VRALGLLQRVIPLLATSSAESARPPRTLRMCPWTHGNPCFYLERACLIVKQAATTAYRGLESTSTTFKLGLQTTGLFSMFSVRHSLASKLFMTTDLLSASCRSTGLTIFVIQPADFPASVHRRATLTLFLLSTLSKVSATSFLMPLSSILHKNQFPRFTPQYCRNAVATVACSPAVLRVRRYYIILLSHLRY